MLDVACMKMCINNSESCHGQTDDKHVLKEPFSVPESDVWECSALVPDDCMCTDDKLGSWVPLVIGYIVVRLKPDPLLTFSQEAVITRLPFSILHHWTEEIAKMVRSKRDVPKKKKKVLNTSTYSVHDTLPVSLGHPHGNSHSLMFPEPQKVSSLWLVELWKWEMALSNKNRNCKYN